MSLHVTSMVIDGNKKAGTLVELHDLAKIDPFYTIWCLEVDEELGVAVEAD